MENWSERTILLIGKGNFKTLQKANILIVGLGGVGGYACEHLCRAGIGNMTIVDGDIVTPSNRNRQIQAYVSSENQKKALVLEKRLLDINPDLNINVISDYIPAHEMKKLLQQNFDYVVDAIDTLLPKVELIELAVKSNLKIVSSMGAGGKTDPMQIKISDISETYNCHLARVLRKRLRRRKIYSGITTVFSSEIRNKAFEISINEKYKKTTLGTISYLPSIFGSMCASVIIRELCKL